MIEIGLDAEGRENGDESLIPDQARRIFDERGRGPIAFIGSEALELEIGVDQLAGLDHRLVVFVSTRDG
jgi:hypothetical protein